MLRFLLILTVVVLVFAAGAGELFAQQSDEWSSLPLTRDFRGAGFYLSTLKVIGCWLLFLFWVWTTDWISRDCLQLKLEHLRWNPIAFGCFLAAFVLLWMIPYFWVGFSLLAIAYVAPLTTYVIYRNSKVTNDLRVLTPAHLRYWFSVRLAKMGVHIQAEAMDPHDKGPPVKLEGRGSGDERRDRANTLAARQDPGLLGAREILFDAFSYRASAVMLDYTPQNVAMRFMIDGVWINREPIERESGDPALEALKTLSGLNPQDRQNRQKGAFVAEYDSIPYFSTLVSQGTKTGERALVQFEDKKIRFDTIDELGMRPKMIEQLKELLYLEKGMLLLSAMPGNGLRSTADVVIRHTDRFTREFMAVEEANQRYEDIENCPVTTYNAADGQTPVDVLAKVFRSLPDVLVIRDLVNGETVNMLCEEIRNEDRLFLSTVRAKDSVDALLRVLALGVGPAEFAQMIQAVVSQRLIRKLCEACKEAYAPTPQILKQLGIPEGRIKAFHRPPQQPEEVCQECNGVGYKGRTAIFELLLVGDNVREVLATSQNPDLLRQAARKDGMRSLQEEGVLLVARGVTSLPELMRVLKQ
jgi:general secretion pathway protein E